MTVMRAAFLWIVLLVSTLGFAQSAPRTFGKTDAEILKMGYAGWMEFHGKRAGETTTDLVEGTDVYRRVLERRNNRLIAKLAPSKGAEMRRLRQRALDYSLSLNEVAYLESGGGTMFRLSGASLTVETEEMLYALLGGKAEPAPRRVVSDVTKALDGVDRLIQAVSKEKDRTPLEMQNMREALARARSAWSDIRRLAAKQNRADSDRILQFCFSAVGVVTSRD